MSQKRAAAGWRGRSGEPRELRAADGTASMRKREDGDFDMGSNNENPNR